ncbi:unnamed protein product, partial [Hymenolepis diminuta]
WKIVSRIQITLYLHSYNNTAVFRLRSRNDVIYPDDAKPLFVIFKCAYRFPLFVTTSFYLKIHLHSCSCAASPK